MVIITIKMMMLINDCDENVVRIVFMVMCYVVFCLLFDDDKW